MVGVPDIGKKLNVTLEKYIDGFTNGSTTKYKTRNFIPIPPLLVKSLVGKIASSRIDTKAILVKLVKEIEEVDQLYADDIKYLDQEKQKYKALVFWLCFSGVDNTTIKAVSTMTCTSTDLVKEFKKLDMDFIKGEKLMVQAKIPDL